MGLIEQEIQELTEMNKNLQEGKLTADDFKTRLAIYSLTEKRESMIIQACSATAEHGKSSTEVIDNFMSGLVQGIKELRQTLKQHQEGKLLKEVFMDRIEFYSHTLKSARKKLKEIIKQIEQEVKK